MPAHLLYLITGQPQRRLDRQIADQRQRVAPQQPCRAVVGLELRGLAKLGRRLLETLRLQLRRAAKSPHLKQRHAPLLIGLGKICPRDRCALKRFGGAGEIVLAQQSQPDHVFLLRHKLRRRALRQRVHPGLAVDSRPEQQRRHDQVFHSLLNFRGALR